MIHNLRVISGFYKGKKLITSANPGIRSTTDRYKETLFNIIEHNFPNILKGEVLDLFSGTGNLGIECLSRGCKKAVFVDNSPLAIDIIRKNLKSLRYHSNYQIIKANASTIVFKPYEYNFSLVFLDPPYISNLITESLVNLLRQPIFALRCLFICESNLDINFNLIPIILSKRIGNRFLKIYQLSL